MDFSLIIAGDGGFDVEQVGLFAQHLRRLVDDGKRLFFRQDAFAIKVIFQKGQIGQFRSLLAIKLLVRRRLGFRRRNICHKSPSEQLGAPGQGRSTVEKRCPSSMTTKRNSAAGLGCAVEVCCRALMMLVGMSDWLLRIAVEPRRLLLADRLSADAPAGLAAGGANAAATAESGLGDVGRDMAEGKQRETRNKDWRQTHKRRLLILIFCLSINQYISE